MHFHTSELHGHGHAHFSEELSIQAIYGIQQTMQWPISLINHNALTRPFVVITLSVPFLLMKFI